MTRPDVDTDAEVLAGAEVRVSLCGHEYVFREPSRKRRRAMLCEVLEFAALMDSQNPRDRLLSVDKALEWMYRWNQDMRKNRLILDEAEEPDILREFRKVVDMLDRPFVLLAMRLRKEAEEARNGTSTQSQGD